MLQKLSMTVKTALLTTLAMLAFAANSVLCRMALGGGSIDAASFTSIRLLSGAICLLFIVKIKDKKWPITKPNLWAVLSLFIYMICFSFAYLSLSTGTGALLLFGSVQLTMISVAFLHGERLSMMAWTGICIAFIGIIYLLLPGITAPTPFYSGLMAVAGLAWGSYSLLGKTQLDPTYSTANNFIYATPLALLVSLIQVNNTSITFNGAILGILSGAIASGVGYAIWYSVLKHIKGTTAAVVQLSVPTIAAVGGIILLSEPLTVRTMIATIMVLGGIAMILKKQLTQSNR